MTDAVEVEEAAAKRATNNSPSTPSARNSNVGGGKETKADDDPPGLGFMCCCCWSDPDEDDAHDLELTPSIPASSAGAAGYAARHGGSAMSLAMVAAGTAAAATPGGMDEGPVVG